ncbi:hypothetical protein Landi51_06877 [Colletotrichum acutatum]
MPPVFAGLYPSVQQHSFQVTQEGFSRKDFHIMEIWAAEKRKGTGCLREDIQNNTIRIRSLPSGVDYQARSEELQRIAQDAKIRSDSGCYGHGYFEATRGI